MTASSAILRPGKLDDLPEVVTIINMCSREMTGKDEFELADYQNVWADVGIDLAADTRIAALPDGRIVGLIEVWNTTPYTRCWIWGRVHPDFRGRGIGTALMDWAENRARVAFERAPADARIMLEVSASSSHIPTVELLGKRGFAAGRHRLTMARDLTMPPTPTWPAGITVRTMQPGEELAVYRAKNEAFRDHWGHVEMPEAEGYQLWWRRHIASPNHDPSLWFLALDGEQIAGVAQCEERHIGEPDMAWVESLSVRRPWRRRRLAQALLDHSFGELYRRGQRRIGLSVDASSLTGATRLYEQAGMRAIQQITTFEKQLRAGVNLATQTVEG